MAADQAFLDEIANSWCIFHGSPLSSRQFYVSNLRYLMTLIRREQRAIRATGATTRTITGQMPLLDVALSGPRTRVETIIVMGADGPAGGGDGVAATLVHLPAAHILIAAGGSATRMVSTKTNGGDATCVGSDESLVIALGGDGATTLNPPTMPYGADGTDGGDGGNAVAMATGHGNVVYSVGGRGRKGSPGQVGRAGSAGITIFGWTFFARPAIAAGTNGDDGDGGDAFSIGGDNSDFYTRGGRAPSTASTLPTTPGAPGSPGTGTIICGTTDVVIVGVTNGDGSRGRVIRR